MNQNEANIVSNYKIPVIGSHLLKNKMPRTLIIGSMQNGQDAHVYLDEVGKIHIVYYRGDMLLRHVQEPFSDNYEFNPFESVITAQCDYEFCILLAEQDIRLSYDRFDEDELQVPEATAPYYGETYERLMDCQASFLDYAKLRHEYPDKSQAEVFSVILQAAVDCKVRHEFHPDLDIVLKERDKERVLVHASCLMLELILHDGVIPCYGEKRTGQLVDRIVSYLEERDIGVQTVRGERLTGDIAVLSADIYGGVVNVTIDVAEPIKFNESIGWVTEPFGEKYLLSRIYDGYAVVILSTHPVRLFERYQYNMKIQFFGNEKLFLEAAKR